MLSSLDEIGPDGSGEEGFQSLLFFSGQFAITISPWRKLLLVEVAWLKIGKIVLENGKKMSLKQ